MNRNEESLKAIFSDFNPSKKSIKSSKTYPGYTQVLDKEDLKRQLDNGVTVYAMRTGPFGEDEGTKVIAFGDISDADVASFIKLDSESYDMYGGTAEYVTEHSGENAIVLDSEIGQSDCNFYLLDAIGVDDCSLYVADDEWISE